MNSADTNAVAQPARRAMSDPSGINEPASRVQRLTRTRGSAANRLTPMAWIGRFVTRFAFSLWLRLHAASRLGGNGDAANTGGKEAGLISRRIIDASAICSYSGGWIVGDAVNEARDMRERLAIPGNRSQYAWH